MTKLGLPCSISVNTEWPCFPVSLFVTVALSVGTVDMWSPVGSTGHHSFSSEQYWKETQVLKEFRAFQRLVLEGQGEGGSGKSTQGKL